MAIYQADQYMIPFTIRHNNEIVTPERARDVAIVLGDLVKRYSENQLSFADNKWLFPITREETIRMQENAKCQIEIIYGDNILHSKPLEVKVKKSLEPFVKE
jgi:hypothetical protein